MTELILRAQYLYLYSLDQGFIYCYKAFLLIFFKYISILIYIVIAIFKTCVWHVHNCKGCYQRPGS